MKVKFLCIYRSFYNVMAEVFMRAKMTDLESFDLAELHVAPGYAKYVTCRNNVYVVQMSSDGVIFSFEGSREALQRLEPFKWFGVEWVEKGENYGVLEVNDRRYELRLIEYQTSTPPEWKLMWFDVVEPILQPDPENPVEAIITRDGKEIAKVPYKRVYPKKPEISLIEFRLLSTLSEAKKPQ
jgi:hypothetical protein